MMTEAFLKVSKEDGEISPVPARILPLDTGDDTDRSFRGKTSNKKRRSRYDELDSKFDKKYTDMDQKLDKLLSLMVSQKTSTSSTTDKPKREKFVSGMATDEESDDSNSVISLCVNPKDKIDTDCSSSHSDVEETGRALNLLDLFGDDARVKIDKKKEGIKIDSSQKEVLEGSFRTNTPSYLTSFSEEVFDLFPVDEETEKFLQVPQLDSLVENCLIKRHGNKAAFAKRKGGKSLFSQPCKMVERISYKGQQASRLGIIIQLYIQQSLGSLLSLLQAETLDKDKAVSQVKDIFSMATKGLDQVGRSGAFHHIIRRTLSMTDTALFELTDASEFQNLPLVGEGVFGPELEVLLKSRKEKKKQVDDLIPDIQPKVGAKRKSTEGISNPQETKKAFTTFTPFNNRSFHSSSNSFNDFRTPRNRDFRSQNFQGERRSSKTATKNPVYDSKPGTSSSGRGRGRIDRK